MTSPRVETQRDKRAEEPSPGVQSVPARVRRSVDRKRADGVYPFVPPKFGRFRDVPLAAEDVARLRRHRLASGRPGDGELVFQQRDGGQWSHEGAHAAFVRACGEAEIAEPLPRPHDARHAFATHMLAAGIGTYAVAQLLGHADEGLVRKRYGHALPDEVAGAGVALEAFRQARRVG
jgi:integrase